MSKQVPNFPPRIGLALLFCHPDEVSGRGWLIVFSGGRSAAEALEGIRIASQHRPVTPVNEQRLRDQIPFDVSRFVQLLNVETVEIETVVVISTFTQHPAEAR